MAEQYYKSVYAGAQIDQGIGKILNGEVDAAADRAQAAAQTATSKAGEAAGAAQAVQNALDNLPEGAVPVINDLTTGGAAVALSAEMGKKLQLEKADAMAVETALLNKMNVPQDIPTNSDLNECRTVGMHYVGYNGSSVLNTPITTSAFSLFVEENNAWGDGVKQTFTPFTSPEIYCRVYYNGTWSKWVLQVTSEPPQEYDLPLAEGATNGGGGVSRYWINQFGEVALALSVEFLSSFANGDIIATLPVGFRPSATLLVSAGQTHGGGRAGCNININADGSITFWGSGAVGDIFWAQGTFVAS